MQSADREAPEDDNLYSISDAASGFGVPVSTLRYYDEVGLVPATSRRARIRHYDRATLMRLAYVQLLRLDGMLSVEDTLAVLASTNRGSRNEVISRYRDELADRIRRLQEAHDLLLHMMRCHSDNQSSCPIVGAYLAERVDAALGNHDAAREPAGPRLSQLAARMLAGADEEAALRLHGLA